MKRYLVFAGFFYYPCGGWEDLAGTADTYESALIMAQQALEKGYEWRHIVDLEAMTVKEEDGAYAGSEIQRRVHQNLRDIADSDIECVATDLMDDILGAARERALKEAEEPGSVIQRDIDRALVDLKKAEIVRVAANLMDSIQPLHTMRIDPDLVEYLRAIQWGDRTKHVLEQSIKAITESPLDLGQSRVITMAVKAIKEVQSGDLITAIESLWEAWVVALEKHVYTDSFLSATTVLRSLSEPPKHALEAAFSTVYLLAKHE